MQGSGTMIHFTEHHTEKAFQLAQRQQQPLLVDFWTPGCKGCKKMKITTYQDPETLAYIQENFVFIKYDITNKDVPKLKSSPILWTPTFIIFANDGSEVRKITGFLNPIRFEAEMEIGRAMAFLRKANTQKACDILENYIAKTSDTSFLPEALYWAGVALYFHNRRNAESLVPHWQRLLEEHPENIWAQKADCLDISL